jgi:hypothetical protein
MELRELLRLGYTVSIDRYVVDAHDEDALPYPQAWDYMDFVMVGKNKVVMWSGGDESVMSLDEADAIIDEVTQGVVEISVTKEGE